MTDVATIADPARFRSSKQVGAHIDLTLCFYQAGEADRAGTITRCQNQALLEAAALMLVCKKSWLSLRSRAIRVLALRGAT